MKAQYYIALMQLVLNKFLMVVYIIKTERYKLYGGIY